MKAPWNWPSREEVEALRSDDLRAFDSIRDQQMAAAVRALAAGLDVEIICNGKRVGYISARHGVLGE
jgi:hypothetical protein